MADDGESLFPPARRAAARVRCDAATPGWYEDGILFIGVDALGHGRGGFTLNCRRHDGSWEYTDAEEQANIEFAAHALNDLHAALAELDRLAAENARLRAGLMAARGDTAGERADVLPESARNGAVCPCGIIKRRSNGV
jgi:hypothetical protein